MNVTKLQEKYNLVMFNFSYGIVLVLILFVLSLKHCDIFDIDFQFVFRLNLFMTSADDHCVIAIARACSKLQYLNLGSCNKISNYDEVCMYLVPL